METLDGFEARISNNWLIGSVCTISASTHADKGNREMESEDRLAVTARRRGKAPPQESHRDEMPGNPTRTKHAALFALQLAIACALFSLDIFLGPGMADGIGYSVVLVLCLRNPKRSYSLGWAGFSTLLVIIGGIISPDRSVIHAASINRVLEICTIWVIWFLIGAIAPKRSD